MRNVFIVHPSSPNPIEYYYIRVDKENYIKNMEIWHKISVYLVIIVLDKEAKIMTDMNKHIENNSTVLFTK